MKDILLILVLTTLLFIGKQAAVLQAKVRASAPNAAAREDRATPVRLKRLPNGGFDLFAPGSQEPIRCATFAEVRRHLANYPGAEVSFVIDDAALSADLGELSRVTPHLNISFSPH